jgi:hypothetical protein
MQLRLTSPGSAMLAALALLTALAAPTAVRAQAWGEIKGQVIWGGAELPKNEKANVNKDQDHCLKDGPIYSDELVVNPKNKGVRWVLVYLLDAEKPTAALPIHPMLKAVPAKAAVIDQPCCKFEPRVLAVREGQKVEVKNPAPVAHNFAINGGALGPNENPLMPPKAAPFVINNITARSLPIPYSCSIHPWMKGWVASFKHPYFAVTDADGKFTIPNAPAGKYRLVLWQEKKGYVLYNQETKEKGPVIEIKANGTTEVGPYKLEIKE